MEDWTRIPVPIESENDRRTLCSVLAANGLDVRIAKVRMSSRGTPKRFVEYRDSGAANTLIETEKIT